MNINFNNVKKGRFMSEEDDVSLLKIQEDEKFTHMIDELTKSDKFSRSHYEESSKDSLYS